jgi:uncharacterized protein
MALTIVLELTGVSFFMTVPSPLVQVGYMLIGWQAGVAFTRESMKAIERILPAAFGLIIALNVASAGLRVLLAKAAGISGLDPYLATSPGGIYAVLATAVDTGSNVTSIVAAQHSGASDALRGAAVGEGFSGGFLRMGRRHGGQIPASTSASRVPIRVAD